MPPLPLVRAVVRAMVVKAPVERVEAPMGLLSIEVVAMVDPVIAPVLYDMLVAEPLVMVGVVMVGVVMVAVPMVAPAVRTKVVPVPLVVYEVPQAVPVE